MDLTVLAAPLPKDKPLLQKLLSLCDSQEMISLAPERSIFLILD